MCWEMDYDYIAAQQKAREKRTEAIDKLLKDASQPSAPQVESTKVEEAPVKEVAPAK
jgi:hypothetical protein